MNRTEIICVTIMIICLMLYLLFIYTFLIAPENITITLDMTENAVRGIELTSNSTIR